MANKTPPSQLRAQAKYQAKPEQVKKRMARNRARYAMLKAGKVKKGQDVDHIDGNPNNNAPSNLRAISKSKNRRRNGR